MYKYIDDYFEFRRRIDILWEPDYEDLELEEFPTTVSGGFAPWRVEEFLRLARLHPEFHTVSCIEPDLFINTFVWGAMTYHLAQGDSDPKLVYDPDRKLDAHFLQTLKEEHNRDQA
jgi:hypothetical protein